MLRIQIMQLNFRVRPVPLQMDMFIRSPNHSEGLPDTRGALDQG